MIDVSYPFISSSEYPSSTDMSIMAVQSPYDQLHLTSGPGWGAWECCISGCNENAFWGMGDLEAHIHQDHSIFGDVRCFMHFVQYGL